MTVTKIKLDLKCDGRKRNLPPRRIRAVEAMPRLRGKTLRRASGRILQAKARRQHG